MGEHEATTVAGFLLGLLFVAFLALAAAIIAIIGVVQVGNIADENTEQREAGEIADCKSFNERSLELRAVLKDSLFALVRPGQVLTAEQEAQIAAYNAKVDDGLPLRDCSEAGIDAYLADHE